MDGIEWLSKLKEEGILTEGNKNENTYLHLQAPCKILLTENATKQIRANYQANLEKGGILVAIPKKENGESLLTVDKLIFLKNVADNPHSSYLPDPDELKIALDSAYFSKESNFLAVRFHTHPTHSDNPINEMLNYVYQCNTSDQDQLVSDFPVKVGELDVLMPRCLILCNGKVADRIFIGFYNGLIAPIEFENHRTEQQTKAMEKIFDTISEWIQKDTKNKWWLIGGGIALALLVIRYNKLAIPLILMIILMSQVYINDKHGKPKYFAQVSTGNVIIDIP